jgi:multidrug efflux pump
LYLPGLYALWFRKSLDERGAGEPAVAAPHHDHPDAPIPLAEAAE